MLQTNLSTRPFYNERLVHLALGIVALLVLALTAFNVTQAVGLSRRHTELTERADRAEVVIADAAREALTIQRDIDRDALEVVAAAAREANTLIDRRIFSWTEFFNRIESTLPPDVMMTSVRPEIETTDIAVSMGVLGRRVEGIDMFMDRLEATGAFAELLARQEEATNEGMYRAALRGRYLPLSESPAPGPDTEGEAGPSLE